jgi:mono/diheme cytochrome c family protein
MNLANLSTAVLATSTIRSIGAVIAVLAVLGVVIYAITNVFAGRDEVGSEIELAPNRKPYYDDDKLETTKLNRTLATAVCLLAVSAIGLPLYWLNEPSRQTGAVDGMLETFEKRGLEQYEVGSQCVNCHAAEAKGGSAPFTLLDANGGFVAQVNWIAPALNTVLMRFSREELFNIIDYGRPGTPMPAWGARGGGPRSDQQIDNVIDYLASIQLSSDESKHAAEVELAIELGLLTEEQREDEDAAAAAIEQIDWESIETGEAAFSLGKDPAFAGGAYACARCHTQGFSIITTEGAVAPADADISPFVDYLPGAGALGPPIDSLIPRQFASVDELAEFISTGTENGVLYGNRGQGSGRMPGFGDNPNTEEIDGDGMLSARMICAIARYESTLHGDQTPANSVATTTTTTSTTVPGESEEEEETAATDEENNDQPLPFCEAAMSQGNDK